jgi:hypothetical protein
MEDEKKGTEKWMDNVARLVETYRDLVAIRIVEKMSNSLSMGILGVVFLIFFLCALVFIGLGTAWWIGKLMNDLTAGFFIVGGAFISILTILLLMARKILKPAIRNLVIKKIYDND